MYTDNIQAIAELEQAYTAGSRKAVVTFENGDEMTLRLFHVAGSGLCYYAPRRKRYGYAMSDMRQKIVSVRPVVKRVATTTIYDRHINNLRKFKRMMMNAHPNLWTDMQAGYANLDIDDYEAFLATNWDTSDPFDLYNCLREYKLIHGLDLITENHYKTTTVRSNLAKYSPDYAANIKEHLDSRTEFSYSWRSASYDVSVSGNVGKDGQYRAWLSLEYKGCGNGHYYLLINENTAIFAEDDQK